MSLSKKLLSAFLSCAIVCTSAVSITAPSAGAEWISDSYYSYDNTYQTESKEVFQPEVSDYGWNENIQTADSETPFDVFGIYDAYQAQTTVPETTVTTTETTVTTTAVQTEETTTTLLTVPETTAPPVATTTAPVVTQAPQTQMVPPIYRKSWGVDVAQWQGWINWPLAKQAGVEFAIVRAGYGSQLSQKDPQFDNNIRNAQAAGVDCGVYWYSYATTVEGAKREAETCYEIIKNYNYTYPIFFDIEDSSQMYLSAATISAMADTFCSTLESKGYYVGIYSSASFLSTKIYKNVLDKYVTWVAHYGVSSPAYSNPYGIWQYSNTGWINGINARVDLNYSYVNYPGIISPQTYTGPLVPGTTAATTPVTTTTTTTTTAPATTTTIFHEVKGIDFGEEKVGVDWNTVKASGYEYAILHAGYGKEVDERFLDHYESAKAAGFNVGASWYTHATSVDEILEEAEIFYELIKDKKFEYPIYLDIQRQSIVDANLSVEEMTNMIDAFCGYFQSKGFYTAIHSYQYFLTTYVDPALYDKYDVWLANYTSVKPDFIKNYGMWQCDGDTHVNGIEGTVAIDKCYRSYPTVMTYYHLNNY